MSVIPKTSAPHLVDATLPKRSGAPGGISLKRLPTLHAEPSAYGVPARVRSAEKVPAAHGPITRRAPPGDSQSRDDTATVAIVAQRLVTSGHFNPQVVEKWVGMRNASNLSESQKDEYTRIACTIVKSTHVSSKEALSIARDAMRFMMTRTNHP